MCEDRGARKEAVTLQRRLGLGKAYGQPKGKPGSIRSSQPASVCHPLCFQAALHLEGAQNPVL